MNDAVIFRMIDANANRAREALRVMEDYARFGLNDAEVSAELKGIRHALAGVLAVPPLDEAIAARDTGHDVGTTIKTEAELTRESLASVVIAAGKRLSEALRVVEECLKTVHPAEARIVEQLRYKGYGVEQVLARVAGGADARARFAAVRVYVLLTESLCHSSLGGRGEGWEKTLEMILSAASAPGQVCVQLREKGLPDATLVARAKAVAERCRHYGALSIINDRPDIALLANADGVHLGQGDLPCAEARQLLGRQKIIGVSTENLAQARQAVRDGATYIALGPMFPTTTKEKPRLAGPAYVAEALREIPPEVPLVPIGGITLANLPELTRLGVVRVCVCAAVIAQGDPAGAMREFLLALDAATQGRN